ncbi:hypothetical protein CASFOL_008094 [Castilleja foliolosa]|uniref:Uncharacterized protein n=1 Tax=Castilleja foliolosa TaxID=1961234 RepID=A0ABD3BD03_9LAMI
MGRASRPISRRSLACGAESRRDWGETVGGSTAKGESVNDLDSGAMVMATMVGPLAILSETH